jgi:hypothetical protein
MRILTISSFLLLGLTGCMTQADGTFVIPSDCDTGDTDCEDIGDDDQDDDDRDTDDGGSDDDDQDDNTDDTGNGNSGNGGSSSDDYDLEVTFTAPGGAQVGSMFCHLEFIEDGLDERLSDDNWGGWETNRTAHWASSVTFKANPGILEGVRGNCTICPDELSVEPYGTDAENKGCTWTGYGTTESEARINGDAWLIYFGTSYSSDTVTFGGGTSVLWDVR